MSDIVREATLGKHNSMVEAKFKQGDTVGVHVKIKEGDKERIQLFKGIVIKVQGSGMGRSFTVRKVSSGIGVERTFPFVSPSVDHVDVLSRGIVRQSRLFYLRGLQGRAAKIESELVQKKSTKPSKKAKKDEAKTEAPAKTDKK